MRALVGFLRPNLIHTVGHLSQVLIHGFADNGRTSWILDMKDEYLKAGNYNIISVDWRKLVKELKKVSKVPTRVVCIQSGDHPWSYPLAALHTHPVAFVSTLFLTRLYRHEGFDLNSTHVSV